jgi:hypothetical protein
MARPIGFKLKPQRPPEVEHIRALLRAFIDMSGLSVRAVGHRLADAGHSFDLNRALSGGQELKLWHLIAICEAIEVHPIELLRMAVLDPPEPSPLVARLRELVRPRKPDAVGGAIAEKLIGRYGNRELP